MGSRGRVTACGLCASSGEGMSELSCESQGDGGEQLWGKIVPAETLSLEKASAGGCEGGEPKERSLEREPGPDHVGLCRLWQRVSSF